MSAEQLPLRTVAGFDFTQPPVFAVSLVLICTVVFLRYLILSGAYHFMVLKLRKNGNSKRLLLSHHNMRSQIRRELILSSVSAVIFGVTGMVVLVLYQLGYTKVYTDVREYPLWYLPVSIVIYLLLHDLYYYWLHRWMHSSAVLRRFHMTHHQSVRTTAFTSFSFHPVESLLQAVILPLIIMFLPMSLTAVFITLFLMTLSAIINHAGLEIYPLGKRFSFIRKNVIGATHHDQHHRNLKKNFGLYFTFWDRWMKTEK
ncbi:sterol desaturase family protein [Kaistella palustris]|uniref:sterol desaturase family protein n=1 Tax=Kaistella palustris TaxID=493376 RepID=UPI0003F86E60|nr:sterol desaturase family protein [Kaistella palustris]